MDQHHGHEPDRPGGRRARSRWWAVGLAGMTGLALTTSLSIGGAPAIGAVDGTVTAADEDRPGRPDHASTNTKDHKGKGAKDKRKGTPVPCDADALIAAITLANARGGAVLDLAGKCTYLLTADIDGGAGLPAITAPITLNGGKDTTITRAAAAEPFRILTVDTDGDLTLNKLKITGGQTAADEDGGGILVNTGGKLIIGYSAITRNIASDNGGGIANNGTAIVSNSTVSHNTAGSIGGGVVSVGVLDIRASHVSANTALAGAAGVFSGGTTRIKRGTITANHAQVGNVGGLVVLGTGTVSDTRITNNTAPEGGGVVLGSGGQLTLRSVTIAGNTARTGRSGGLGIDPNASVVVEDSIIKNNDAIDGGGIYSFAEVVLRRTVLTGNQAGNEGGGIYNTSDGEINLFSTKIMKNVAITDGGGIFNQAGGTVELNTATGTTVVKNRPNNCVNVTGCPG
ncbi:hypothetical protein [Salinispora tropica]|uniref:hypothetical protein n=1 Tax=Salinispora tropica TaxID=168695 RepID=UPI00048E2DE3|nr:hypothetical protein [Salinispora tropica]